MSLRRQKLCITCLSCSWTLQEEELIEKIKTVFLYLLQPANPFLQTFSMSETAIQQPKGTEE